MKVHELKHYIKDFDDEDEVTLFVDNNFWPAETVFAQDDSPREMYIKGEY
jgi:hypothetical protein